MGIKFSAACTLLCEEFDCGTPPALLSANARDLETCFPAPTTPPGVSPSCRDITFALVDGDFQVRA